MSKEEEQLDFLTLASMPEEEAAKIISYEEEVVKLVEPFEVDSNLRKFLFALRLALKTPNQWDTLTPLQNASKQKQQMRLRLTLVAACGKDMRKHLLSAMIGRTIKSQNDLDWFDNSKILDALKEERNEKGEKDNGTMVLKTIQAHIEQHPVSRPCELYTHIFNGNEHEDDEGFGEMPDM